MRVDLHIHTQASDGTWTPIQVIEKVKESGIGLFAIADHDAIDNVATCQALIPGSGLGYLRAVEISATMGDRMLHILAYGIDIENRHLNEILEENKYATEAAHQKNLDQLIQSGMAVDLTEYRTYRHDSARGGWKILNFLIDQGLCKDMDDLFRKLFNLNHPLALPAYPSPGQVIEIIVEAGGIPVLAHPGGQGKPLSNEIMKTLMGVGLRGLECYSSYHDQQNTIHYLKFCRDHNLLITGGSDCHGDFAPHRKLGLPVIESAELKLGEIMAGVVTDKQYM
jgi:predicted metal-dependent phosphoesterase TrpH